MYRPQQTIPTNVHHQFQTNISWYGAGGTTTSASIGASAGTGNGNGINNSTCGGGGGGDGGIVYHHQSPSMGTAAPPTPTPTSYCMQDEQQMWAHHHHHHHHLHHPQHSLFHHDITSTDYHHQHQHQHQHNVNTNSSTTTSTTTAAAAALVMGIHQTGHNIHDITRATSGVITAAGSAGGELPSPPITVSGSDLSSPGGVGGISVGVGGVCSENISPSHHSNQNLRPPPARSPYEWIKKTNYQNQPNPGKTRTKDKYRVVYTDHQRVELEKEFYYSRYITIRRKAELANNLGLSERQVKIWFQNRRAKERKQVKKREDYKDHTNIGNIMVGHHQPSPLPTSLHQQPHGQSILSNIGM